MPIIYDKPASVEKSQLIDLSGSRYFLFCDTELSIPVGSDADYLQSLVQDESIQYVEVYGVTKNSAEKKVIDVNGREKYGGEGEQRYTGNAVTTLLNPLPDFKYYTDKWFYVVSELDIIKGIPDGNNIKPFPLSSIDGGTKSIVSDGQSAETPSITVRIDGKQALKADEWCLDFDFSQIMSPTETVVLGGFQETGVSEGTTIINDSNGDSALNNSLGTITSDIDDYIEVYGGASKYEVTALSIGSSAVFTIDDTWSSETDWQIIYKSSMMKAGFSGLTQTYTP